MEKTKVIYYLNNEKIPYTVTLAVKPDNASLRDLKKILEKDHKFKVFFHVMDEEFGLAKEEIKDDDVKLPVKNGRAIVSVTQIMSLVHGDKDYQNQYSHCVSPSAKKSKINDVRCVGCQQKSDLLAAKDKLIEEKEKVIVEKEKTINFLSDRSKRLNTEIAYKDGYLHCHGILEKCEYLHCNDTMLTSWTRKQRWCDIFDNHLKEIFDVTVFKNQNSEQLAKEVVEISKNLSNRNQNFYGSIIKKLHINSITPLQAQIVAFVCDNIEILWESDIIDKSYKQLNN